METVIAQGKNAEETFIESLRSLRSEPAVWESLSDSGKEKAQEILKDFDTGEERWKEGLSSKIDVLVNDLEENWQPNATSKELDEKVGWFIDIASGSGKSVSKGRAIEDVLEHATDLGLHLPKSFIETMNNNLHDKKVTVEALQQCVDKIADRHGKKGLDWWVNNEPKQNQPLMRLQDRSGKCHAYIMERTNNATQERFYSANRINYEGKHIQIGTNKSLEGLKNRVTAYYTGITVREICGDIGKSHENRNDPSSDKPRPEKPAEKSRDAGIDL
jgi:hypothetical protein